MRRVGSALALVAVLLSMLLASLLIWPRSGTVVPADAVVVPSGDPGARLERALQLMARNVAPTLVLDGTPDFARVDELCRGGVAFEVVCLRPEPDSTRNEARALGRLGKDRGWRRVILVTSSVHVSRAGLLFRRCFKGEVVTVGVAVLRSVGIRDAVRALAHEAGGLAHGSVVRRC